MGVRPSVAINDSWQAHFCLTLLNDVNCPFCLKNRLKWNLIVRCADSTWSKIVRCYQPHSVIHEATRSLADPLGFRVFFRPIYLDTRGKSGCYRNKWRSRQLAAQGSCTICSYRASNTPCLLSLGMNYDKFTHIHSLKHTAIKSWGIDSVKIIMLINSCLVLLNMYAFQI